MTPIALGVAGDETIIADNPARWTSKYGSIVTTVYGIGTADGFNEKGLGVHSSNSEAIACVFAVARNVSVPFGAPYRGFGIYNTEYRTVMDLTTLRYYFELTTSPNVIWIDLTRLPLGPGIRVRTLDPDDIDLSGDVTDGLRRSRIEPF